MKGIRRSTGVPSKVRPTGWPIRLRRFWPAIAAAIPAVALVAACGGGSTPATQPSGTPSPSASASASATPSTAPTTTPDANTLAAGIHGKKLCIATGGGLPILSHAQLMTELRGIKKTGATCIRFDIDASVPLPMLDAVVHGAEQVGLKILGILDGTPASEYTKKCPSGTFPMCGPSWGQYEHFLRMVVLRYEPKPGSDVGIVDWEGWNEENYHGFWGPVANVRHYASWLCPAYHLIHQLEPGATVLLGGLGPPPIKAGDIDPYTFLADMYKLHDGGCFDGVGFHAYNDFPGVYPLRELMVRNGDGGKQIWITEDGVQTGPMGVSQADQAALLTSTVPPWLKAPWLGPYFWFNYRDDEDGTFGLVTASGGHKKVYDAFVRIEHRFAA